MVSCSEWTGVPLRLLLEEAGADLNAPWLLAEGADAAKMSRSVPMAKALDDAFLALYQNGERLRPENGYPVRLFLPGYEGNMNVKWLRRLKVTPTPIMTKDETSRYTDLQADGKSLMFTYPMDVKSVITRPSPGVTLREPGIYEVSGIAWSGHGTIKQVEVSADGGQTWAAAALCCSGAATGPDALPHRLEVERGSHRAEEPRHRRQRCGPANARRPGRRAWHQRHLPLQRHPGVADSDKR